MKKWWKYKLSGTELCMKCRCTCGDRETLVSTTECLGLVRFNLSLTQSDTEQKQALTKQAASIHLSPFYISDSWQTFTHIKQEKKPSVLVVCGPGQVAQRAAGAERKTKQLPAAGTAGRNQSVTNPVSSHCSWHHTVARLFVSFLFYGDKIWFWPSVRPTSPAHLSYSF